MYFEPSRPLFPTTTTITTAAADTDTAIATADLFHAPHFIRRDIFSLSAI